ncbi:hypothetical protein HMPREF9947_0004 [Propionibacterium sp. 409-HC1]|nr:hypothetical protein HMPREF9947_0004 [Propionibacterium sp. 409-HC1]
MLDKVRAGGLAKVIRHSSQPTRTTPFSTTGQPGLGGVPSIEAQMPRFASSL